MKETFWMIVIFITPPLILLSVLFFQFIGMFILIPVAITTIGGIFRK